MRKKERKERRMREKNVRKSEIANIGSGKKENKKRRKQGRKKGGNK